MKKIHPFFTLGTVGMLVTSLMHILLALGFSITSAHSSFFMIYSTFLAFLVIGVGLSVKNNT